MIAVTPSPLTLSVTLPSGHKETISEEDAKKLVEAIFAALGCATYMDDRIGKVFSAVCSEWHVTPDQIKSACRTEELVIPRQAAMALLQEEAGTTSTWAGTLMGGRDHGTALYAIKATRNRIATDRHFAERFESVRASIRNGK